MLPSDSKSGKFYPRNDQLIVVSFLTTNNNIQETNKTKLFKCNDNDLNNSGYESSFTAISAWNVTLST